MLSHIQTTWYQLSTIYDGPPFSPERETYSMLLFVQLLHSCSYTKAAIRKIHQQIGSADPLACRLQNGHVAILADL